MTRLIRWCLERFGSSRSQPSADAQTRRREAYAKLRDAESRGDTRDIGHWRMRLMQATHTELSGGAGR